MSNNYLDKIMSNHVFNSESSEDLSYLYSEKEVDSDNEIDDDNDNEYGKRSNPMGKMIGGKVDDTNQDSQTDSKEKPTGGFPPIFIVSVKDKEEEKYKNRRLTTVAGKISVSIKDILKSKK